MARRDSQGLNPAGAPRLRLRPALWALAAVMALASCATLPRSAVAERDEFSAVGGGARLYLRFGTDAVRPVLAAVAERLPSSVGGRRLAGLMDRTDSAAVALFGAGEPRRYLAAAAGRYPVGSAAFSLALSGKWKKVSAASGVRYWRSEEGISLAFARDGALVSDGEPVPTGLPVDRPAAYAAEIADAPLSGWIAEPADAIAELLAASGVPLRLPIEEFVFALLPAGPERFFLEARLVAASPERARALAAILNLARTALSGADAASGGAFAGLFASRPVAAGDAAILRSAPLTADEIALLCTTVSIHLSR